jgi:predicted transcriptional regulator
MKTWKEFFKKQMEDPEFASEYSQLPPVELVAQILEARAKRGITQKVLADMIGTKQPAIARLESGDYTGCSLKTLQKIADALETTLKITIKPANYRRTA